MTSGRMTTMVMTTVRCSYA